MAHDVTAARVGGPPPQLLDLGRVHPPARLAADEAQRELVRLEEGALREAVLDARAPSDREELVQRVHMLVQAV
eukprot:8778776-Alexandrium_andersonii.AAC.1